ncbi:MAG TPA: UvrD-helicase domain-containing protein, partial [Prevotella sp.]
MHTNNGKKWTPDACQQQVIQATRGCHLVLAPPGCGKTQILTERIRTAHEAGVPYGQMLCLTFTNRAARGMKERIRTHLGDKSVEEVYVGNVHRFCSKFLFDNGIVPAESSVIDDDDAVSILSRFLDEDEYAVAANATRRRQYAEVFQLAGFMHQMEHRHAKNLRMHPDCITANDVAAMRRICTVQHMPFNAEAMMDMFSHTDVYLDITRSDAYDFASQQLIAPLLRKMQLA